MKLRVTEKRRERERERDLLLVHPAYGHCRQCWSSLKPEARNIIWSPTRWQGSTYLYHPLQFFLAHWQGIHLKVERPRCEPVPIWCVGAVGCGFICYATAPAAHCCIFYHSECQSSVGTFPLIRPSMYGRNNLVFHSINKYFTFNFRSFKGGRSFLFSTESMQLNVSPYILHRIWPVLPRGCSYPRRGLLSNCVSGYN